MQVTVEKDTKLYPYQEGLGVRILCFAIERYYSEEWNAVFCFRLRFYPSDGRPDSTHLIGSIIMTTWQAMPIQC